VSNDSIASSLAHASSQVQDKASDAFRTGRRATADGLDAVASRMNAGGDRIAEAAHNTADSLGASAKYLRKRDPRDMATDIESLIKAHPGKALLGAAVLGFLAGRAFRRD
jgi:hypothetical protein